MSTSTDPRYLSKERREDSLFVHYSDLLKHADYMDERLAEAEAQLASDRAKAWKAGAEAMRDQFIAALFDRPAHIVASAMLTYVEIAHMIRRMPIPRESV